jgi:hypothetical protein
VISLNLTKNHVRTACNTSTHLSEVNRARFYCQHGLKSNNSSELIFSHKTELLVILEQIPLDVRLVSMHKFIELSLRLQTL